MRNKVIVKIYGPGRMISERGPPPCPPPRGLHPTPLPQDWGRGRGRGPIGHPVEIVPNEHASEGQSASIRLATERLLGDPDCKAIIFSVVDQPFLTSSVFDLLSAAAEESPGQILVSTYAGQRGSPVLFPQRYFPDLLGLEGDVGGREIMRRHPEAVREIAMPDSEIGRASCRERV